MRIIRDIKNTILTHSCVLAIGNFDGLHIGHEKIIKKTLEIASNEKINSAILSFSPHPASFFKKLEDKNFLITNISQKIKLLNSRQLDYFFIGRFNSEIANMEARDFVKEILFKKLKVKYIVIGYDFIFGKNRQGNINLLREMGDEMGFHVVTIEEVRINNKTASSSLIRNLLKSGEIGEANKILGRNFSISGTVIEGKKIARSIGYPTANIKVKKNTIHPKYGVYRGKIGLENQIKDAIINFGIRPTLSQDKEPLYEIHILDFNGSLYNKKISFELIEFIREEKKFSSIKELKNQIEIDIEKIKN